MMSACRIAPRLLNCYSMHECAAAAASASEEGASDRMVRARKREIGAKLQCKSTDGGGGGGAE